MGLIAKETGGGGHDPIPEGTYEAVCYAVIDLGTHYSEAYKKAAHKVLIQWEIPECRITVERGGKDVDLPRAVHRKYTMSLHKKATLRGDLEAWRGKAFTEAELAGFDLEAIAGASCMLGIVHETGMDGKTYANISNILALPRRKGQQRLQPENPVVTFAIPDLPKPGFAIPDTLPDWVVEVIQQSEEWTGKASRPAIAAPVQIQDGHERTQEQEAEPVDNLPF